ncbi:TPA: RNA-binding protein [Candidatus Dependentiae bacterium]|nr:MAG: hypothetical protein UR14_C0003G0036 [candidate division TM6 bacterium GW2011_GWE2_31_21]KKP54156.1 MAG: hypothetical protein UR43_C0001G0174 [candidate division TM6 bacterium GW2011_GWF2_33_332]HBS47877.1 RNA-binding protein [Candidatus Dependentiae bacterium]HBZ73062.1 RNA-binding protein [Candidatus Dependentiae bacterium]
MLKDLIESILKKLVDHPDKISIKESLVDHTIHVEIKVAPEDLGKIIGKEGKMARVIRTLAHLTAAQQGQNATLDILEQAKDPK